MTTTVRSADYVQSLDRGLAVIRSFSRDKPTMTLSDVAREADLTRAAARRFLLTLQTLGYVGSNGRQFFLRPRVLELGYAYLSSFSVADIAQQHLEELAEELHESCSASVLDGSDIVYVARASTNRIMTISLSVGTRLPAYATSMGLVQLAQLPPDDLDGYFEATDLEPLTERTVTDQAALRELLVTVRRQGYAMVDQQLEAGVRSVAVPLHSADGAVVAAVNTSAHSSRVPLSKLRDRFLPRLQACADKIDADLRAHR